MRAASTSQAPYRCRILLTLGREAARGGRASRLIKCPGLLDGVVPALLGWALGVDTPPFPRAKIVWALVFEVMAIFLLRLQHIRRGWGQYVNNKMERGHFLKLWNGKRWSFQGCKMAFGCFHSCKMENNRNIKAVKQKMNIFSAIKWKEYPYCALL